MKTKKITLKELRAFMKNRGWVLDGEIEELLLTFAQEQVNKSESTLPVMPALLQLRKKAGLTLRKVEEDTGISNCYLSQLETGKIDNPSYRIVRTLVNYYAKPVANRKQ